MPEKEACLAMAMEVYEDALICGLCPQGALEVVRSSVPGIKPTLSIQDLDRAMNAASEKPPIRIKRIYDSPSRDDGLRVLVDRLWPRGVSKASAKMDEWFKDLAPSDALRKWFGHDPARWDEFQRRYELELKALPARVDALRDLAAKQTLTLLYAANDEAHNNAVMLRDYLTRRKSRKRARGRAR